MKKTPQTYNWSVRLYIEPGKDRENYVQAREIAECLKSSEVFQCKEAEFHKKPVKEEELEGYGGTIPLELHLTDLTEEDESSIIGFFGDYVRGVAVIEKMPVGIEKEESQSYEMEATPLLVPEIHEDARGGMTVLSGKRFVDSDLIIYRKEKEPKIVSLRGLDVAFLPLFVDIYMNPLETRGVNLVYGDSGEQNKYPIVPRKGNLEKAIGRAKERSRILKDQIIFAKKSEKPLPRKIRGSRRRK